MPEGAPKPDSKPAIPSGTPQALLDGPDTMDPSHPQPHSSLPGAPQAGPTGNPPPPGPAYHLQSQPGAGDRSTPIPHLGGPAGGWLGQLGMHGRNTALNGPAGSGAEKATAPGAGAVPSGIPGAGSVGRSALPGSARFGGAHASAPLGVHGHPALSALSGPSSMDSDALAGGVTVSNALPQRGPGSSSVSAAGGTGSGTPGGGTAGAPAVVPSGPEERATRAALEKAEAEKRLREAEQRLRLAVEELYNKHHKKSDRYSAVFEARHPLCQHGDSCVANAVGSLCQSFLLAYSVRVGVGVLLRAFKLVRNRSFRSVLDLQLLLSEKNLIVREEAVRNGLLFGGFSGVYHAMRCMLRRYLDRDMPSHSFIAGATSGLCLFALDDPQKRRSLALYLLARLGQCLVNSPRARQASGGWLPQWKHGGTLLFCLSSAQIMYAFVMRPETLPKSYFDFIVKTGPISGPVVEAVRRSVRGLPVNAVPLSAFLRQAAVGSKGAHPGRQGGSLGRGPSYNTQRHQPMGLGPHPPLIPCSVLHPREPSCVKNELLVLKDTFRKTFPLYLSLTFVPFVVLNLQKFMQSPLRTAWLASRSAARSTAFLALFVGIYQAAICAHRQVAIKDHKFVYWLAGSVAGLSALVEKPSRRTELALYTLPRAADSLWYILVNVHLLPDIKYAEVALFCLCVGGVVYYHEHEPDTMAPFLRGILSRFLKGTGSPSLPLSPSPSSSHSSSLPLSHSTSTSAPASSSDPPAPGRPPGTPSLASSSSFAFHVPPSGTHPSAPSAAWSAASGSSAGPEARGTPGSGAAPAGGAPGGYPGGAASAPGAGAGEMGHGKGVGMGIGMGLGMGLRSLLPQAKREGKGSAGERGGEAGKEEADWKLTAQRLEAAFQGL